MTRLLCVLLSLWACRLPNMAAAETPNIVLIYADDVGFGDVSCNGGSALQTPHIDRIAREGLRMTDAHCSAATCTPSRFAMLTGQYAFRQTGTGILPGDARAIIPPGTVTMASLLKSAGYATGVVGKWHLGLGTGNVDWNGTISPGPQDIGFDEHFLIPATGDRVPCVYVQQGRVVDLDPADPMTVSYNKRIGTAPSGEERPDLLKQMFSHGHNQTIVNGVSRIGWMTGGERARWIDEDMADVITSRALEFMAAHRSEPFFLYFSTHDIHVPRVPHSRFVGSSGLGPRGDAMRQLDWCVGEVLRQLDELSLTDSTLVMFTSDNGPVLDDGYVDDANEKLGGHDPNGPWRAGKYSSFEGGTRVPFVARWPGRITPGSTSAALFGQIDLTRTLAAVAGVVPPAESCRDSRNEFDTLIGQDPVGRPHLIHETGNQLVLRQGAWKFIPASKSRDGLGPWTTAAIDRPGALFNTLADPGEEHDVAAQHPELVQTLSDLLAHVRNNDDGVQP